MQTPIKPDKLPYTKSEKIADVLSTVFCIIIAVLQIILFAAGVFGSSAIFTSITTLLVCAAFSFVSLYPQHTNIFQEKNTTEQMFRKLRKQGIASKVILAVILFLIVFL